MIKIGLLGLGKTGKIVAQSLFHDKRFELVFVVKNKPVKAGEFHFVVEPKEMLGQLIEKFRPEILIDFTTPKATMRNIRKLKRGMGIVIATTGFTDTQVQAMKRVRRRKILYAPNISSGINTLMKACCEIDNVWPGADIEIIEQHFKTKKDAPSGTAKKIGNLFHRLTPIHAVRAGGIVGIHKVIFAKNNQKIVIKHESFSREVFAASAKEAILWLKEQRAGFYTMREMYEY